MCLLWLKFMPLPMALVTYVLEPHMSQPGRSSKLFSSASSLVLRACSGLASNSHHDLDSLNRTMAGPGLFPGMELLCRRPLLVFCISQPLISVSPDWQQCQTWFLPENSNPERSPGKPLSGEKNSFQQCPICSQRLSPSLPDAILPSCWIPL